MAAERRRLMEKEEKEEMEKKTDNKSQENGKFEMFKQSKEEVSFKLE